MDNCQVSGTYWPVRFAFGQCNWTSLPTRAALHNNTHSLPCNLPLPPICNAMPTSIIMLIIIMRFVALCQPQVLGAPECLLPLASFLLPAALWVVPVEWWLLLGGVGCCLVPQSSAYFTQSVGPASRYNLPLLPLPPRAVAQLLVEIYRATWPEKEKFLCHTNLFRQCLLAGSQTDDWLNIQIHTHACTSVRVCVCVGILYDELLPCRMTDHLAIGLAFAPHKIAIFLQVLNEKLFWFGFGFGVELKAQYMHKFVWGY